MTKEQSKEGASRKKRVEVQEATKIAVNYLSEIVGPVADIKIEEVEIDANKNHWFVTLGYSDKTGYALWTPKYKRFTIDAFTGEVLSMKIRKI